MHRRHLSIAFAAAVLALVAATALPASNLALGPLVQVSGATPFMGCTLDNVSGQSGTAYISSEVEPWIDVNPANADNMIGVWQQDRWSNGGSRGNVAGVTMNGGAELDDRERAQDITLHGWHSCERRRLPACNGSVGDLRTYRDRVPTESVVQ